VIQSSLSRRFKCNQTIDEICGLSWHRLTRDELVDVAWGYYAFSIQFRENLQLACDMHPTDGKLRGLWHQECNTDNLSPWPGVADHGERIDHDEFIRRFLQLAPIDHLRRKRLETIGHSYLRNIRQLDASVRASSIASYEDGGLEQVFRAILRSPDWDSPLLQAFKHFLTEHIRFDSDPEEGHGALSRHLGRDDRSHPLWAAFKHILIESAPGLIV
jgi:hypothetical protein